MALHLQVSKFCLDVLLVFKKFCIWKTISSIRMKMNGCAVRVLSISNENIIMCTQYINKPKINASIQNKIIYILKPLMEQQHFQFNQKCYKHMDQLQMFQNQQYQLKIMFNGIQINILNLNEPPNYWIFLICG